MEYTARYFRTEGTGRYYFALFRNGEVYGVYGRGWGWATADDVRAAAVDELEAITAAGDASVVDLISRDFSTPS